MKYLTLKIFGLVQGVGFRWSSREKARELSIVGWVKNEIDGSVTVVAEGEEMALKNFLNWCKTGPRWARVDEMKEEWGDGKGAFEDFGIRFAD